MITNPLVHRHPNELSPALTGNTTNLSNWIANASSPRLSMLGGHVSQALTIRGATKRNILNGPEFEYAKTTFRMEMPTTGRVIAVLQKFPSKIGSGGFRSNPQTVIIYEDLEKQRLNQHALGCVVLSTHHSKHQTFGFEYDRKQLNDSIMRFKRDDIIPKGYVFADSPGVAEDGDYKFGVETDVVFLSLREIIEDGFVASEDWCEANTVVAMGEATCSVGKKYYLLNLYGDDETYKPFPDVGEKIRPDGLLFAMRTYDELLAPSQMSLKALRRVDYKFDKRVYAKPNAVVTDVSILHDFNNNCPPTPFGMEVQMQRYQTAQDDFYGKILDTYRTYVRHSCNGRYQPEKIHVSPELDRLLVEGLANDPKSVKQSVTRTYRATPIDDWWINIKYTYDYKPTIGSKIAGLLGNKGVICDVRPVSEMPVDQFGRIAHLVMCGDSVIKRMNPGVVYEQYVNATGWWVRKNTLELMEAGREVDAWRYLMAYYSIVSPLMYKGMLAKVKTDAQRKEHLQSLYEVPDSNGYKLSSPVARIWLPSNSPNIGGPLIQQLREYFPVPFGPVTYTTKEGTVVTTVDAALIGSLYIVLLEKIGDDWGGVASAKRQHFGILAKLTQLDRNSKPWRENPTRILGEAEIRLLVATIGPQATADLLEAQNSPSAQRLIARTILTSVKPTDIQITWDKTKVKRGLARSTLYVNHVMAVSGIRFQDKL